MGGPRSPRDATGATVYLTAGGMRQRADVVAGGSFASSSDPRPHFGLGSAAGVNALEVHWPDGGKESFTLPGVNAVFTLTEGHGKPIPSGR